MCAFGLPQWATLVQNFSILRESSFGQIMLIKSGLCCYSYLIYYCSCLEFLQSNYSAPWVVLTHSRPSPIYLPVPSSVQHGLPHMDTWLILLPLAILFSNITFSVMPSWLCQLKLQCLFLIPNLILFFPEMRSPSDTHILYQCICLLLYVPQEQRFLSVLFTAASSTQNSVWDIVGAE